MALPTWPASLPFTPSEEALKRRPYRTVNATTPEDGPLITRVQSNTRLMLMDYELPPYTQAQKVLFNDFVENTLGQGQGHFMADVPLVNGSYVTRRCFLLDSNWSDSAKGAWTFIKFTLVVFVMPSS